MGDDIGAGRTPRGTRRREVDAGPPPEGSVIDRRTLNRTLLARQHLLERTTLPVADLIELLVGLQAQVPRDPYVSLWSRLRHFDPSALEALLLERRAIRMTLMRATLHLVTAADAVTLRPVMQVVCEQGFRASPFRRRLDGVDLPELLQAGALLLEQEPMTTAQLGAALVRRWPDSDATSMAYAVRYLVPLVQVTPRGLFRSSGAPRLTTLESWLRGSEVARPREHDRVSAPDATILRYLRAFGPATTADIRTWSGLRDLRSVVERLRPQLRTFRDERGRELLDAPDAPFASPDAPAPVRFTGEYDDLFLSHADRTRITGDLAWGTAYARQGAFFVDGSLAGAWTLGKRPNEPTITLDPRRPLTDDERRATELEAEALARFLAPPASRPAVVWRAA